MSPARLAWASLWHSRTRVVISVVGVAFAVVLLFMQLGFLGATERTATIFYDELEFDILVTSSSYVDLSRAGRFPRTYLEVAAAVPEVNSIETITFDQGLWQNPTKDPDAGGLRWSIVMVGVEPGSLQRVFRAERQETLFGGPGNRGRAAAAAAQISTQGQVLLDRQSKPFFGGTELRPGTITEYNSQRVQLAGYFKLGTGFSYTGLLLASQTTAAQLNPQSPPDTVSFGLIRVRPGESVDSVAAAMATRLGPELPLRIWTRDAIRTQEQDYWLTKTPVGQFFGFGVGLALVVGAIFVYQMMVADIKKRLPEYATLKAIGYPFRFLFQVVVIQSCVLAVAGYATGLLVSLGLYELAKSQLPIGMTFGRLLGVGGLTLIMCVGSALVAVRQVRTADPADLF